MREPPHRRRPQASGHPVGDPCMSLISRWAGQAGVHAHATDPSAKFCPVGHRDQLRLINKTLILPPEPPSGSRYKVLP